MDKKPSQLSEPLLTASDRQHMSSSDSHPQHKTITVAPAKSPSDQSTAAAAAAAAASIAASTPSAGISPSSTSGTGAASVSVSVSSSGIKASQVVPYTPSETGEQQRLLPRSPPPNSIESGSAGVCCCCLRSEAPPRAIKTFALTNTQKTRLEALRAVSSVPFDSKNEQHVSQLVSLGKKVFGNEWKGDAAADGSAAVSVRSNAWGRIGFQGMDPATDLRGSIGLLSLQNLSAFIDKHSAAFRAVTERKSDPEHYLPAAISGINVTNMLVNTLCVAQSFNFVLNETQQRLYLAFITLIGDSEYAFAEIYNGVLLALFAYWERANCTYMSFGPTLEVIKQKFIRCMMTRPETVADFQQFMKSDHT